MENKKFVPRIIKLGKVELELTTYENEFSFEELVTVNLTYTARKFGMPEMQVNVKSLALDVYTSLEMLGAEVLD